MNIEEIAKNMREPKLGDMRAQKHLTNPEDKEIALVASLSGLSEDELDGLTLKEYGVLQARLKDFLF